MKSLALLLAAAALVSVAAAAANNTRVVCYYSSWAVYRVGAGKFTVGDIDPSLCTHVVYSFIGLQSSGDVYLTDPWNDVGDASHQGQFQQFQLLRKANPDVKLLVAIGGFTAGPANFQEVVRKPLKRAIFVQSAVDLLTQYKFDGLDIDWEYQDSVGGTAADKTGLTSLLTEMREEFDKNDFILSIATPPNFALVDNCYELEKISKIVDFINIMSYDFHGAWEAVTGHVTPLHTGPTGSQELSVEALIKYYIKSGADPSKINLGLITYGRSFTLLNEKNNGLGAAAKGAGNMGSVIPEAGVLAYADICINEWAETWDDDLEVPFASEDDQWVGYDNPKSISAKVAFAKGLGITGVMIWSLESDDFNGNCGDAYPIVRAANDILKSA